MEIQKAPSGHNVETLQPLIPKLNKQELFKKLIVIDNIIANILRYLTPHDALELLISTKFSFELFTPWWIILCWLKLDHLLTVSSPNSKNELHITEFGIHCTFDHPRKLVSHTIRNLGYACNRCYKPLDGPNGFFAFTSHCNECSIFIFEEVKAAYVDSTIRFYLCGNDSVVTRGRAYLSHPYWLTTDTSYESVITKYGSAFQLAQIMWEEKNFFDKYAIGIERPRDDKPNSIRLMLERNQLSTKEPQSGSNENGNTSNGNSESIKDPEWVQHLPISLKGIFADQKEALKSGQCAPQSLGTMPLKELVRTMHTRIGAIVKY